MRRTLACAVLAVGVVLSVGGIEAKAEERVTITGGATDTTCHNYEWRVTNHHSSPIVYVEFPHYRADLFSAPNGWRQDCTYLVNVGVADKPGVCKAWVEPPMHGIAKQASERFGMRITGVNRAPLGVGTVIVRFEDGAEVKVHKVQLPEPPDPSAKWVPLIGTGVLLAGVVIVQTVRRRRAAAAEGAAVETPPDETD